MNIHIVPDNRDTRHQTGAWSTTPSPGWRRVIIFNRAALSSAWDKAFPKHDFRTGRLRQYPLDDFERACARADAERRAGRRESQDTLRAKRLLADNISIDRAWSELNDRRRHGTPRATIEAILHCVRERGLKALREPANVERLSRCDAAAKAEVDRRIAKLKGISRRE
jgi:hypothetical protein